MWKKIAVFPKNINLINYSYENTSDLDCRDLTVELIGLHTG